MGRWSNSPAGLAASRCQFRGSYPAPRAGRGTTAPDRSARHDAPFASIPRNINILPVTVSSGGYQEKVAGTLGWQRDAARPAGGDASAPFSCAV
jgi:hypothetical protein